VALREREARKQEREARERRRRQLMWATVAVAVVFLSLAYLAWRQRDEAIYQTELATKALREAEIQQGKAEQQAQLATSRELAAAAQNKLETDPELSALLALQATYAINADDMGVLPEAEEALQKAVQASRVQLTLRGHSREVYSVAFSPDGQRIATGAGDGTAKVWDAASGTEFFSLTGHTSVIEDVAFSLNSKRIATASRDGTARVWDATSSRELFGIARYPWVTLTVAFNPAAPRLAVSSQDGKVYIYTLDVDELITIARKSVSRSLTAEECQIYLHQDRCPQ
jgi:WD domain, G-beta repeat